MSGTTEKATGIAPGDLTGAAFIRRLETLFLLVRRVLGGSMTDTQPVFEAIVKNCSTLFNGSRVTLFLIDDDRLHARASTGNAPEPIPFDRGSAIGACMLERRVISLADLEKGSEEYPRIRNLGVKFGYRSGIYAPLLLPGRALGGIAVLRLESGSFDAEDVALSEEEGVLSLLLREYRERGQVEVHRSDSPVAAIRAARELHRGRARVMLFATKVPSGLEGTAAPDAIIDASGSRPRVHWAEAVAERELAASTAAEAWAETTRQLLDGLLKRR